MSDFELTDPHTAKVSTRNADHMGTNSDDSAISLVATDENGELFGLMAPVDAVRALLNLIDGRKN